MYGNCEKPQIEKVLSHNEIKKTYKEDPLGHGVARRKKERQTGKDNIPGWTGLKSRSSVLFQQSFRLKDK